MTRAMPVPAMHAAVKRMHGDGKRHLQLAFTPARGVDAATHAAAARSKLLDLLCNNQLVVAGIVVEPQGIAHVTYWEWSEDALFAKKTSDDLHANGFKYNLSREARAKRTLVVHGVDESFPSLIRGKWVETYPLLSAPLDVFYVPQSQVLKLTLTSISDAQHLAEEGITIGCFTYPPACITFGRYTHLQECFTCYDPAPIAPHRTKSCPLKGQLLCSICGAKGHRHDAPCPNTDVSAHVCLVCSRHPDAARRADARHGTRTMQCPVRRAAVHKGRSAPPPVRAHPQAHQQAPPAAPPPRGPSRMWHSAGPSFAAVVSPPRRESRAPAPEIYPPAPGGSGHYIFHFSGDSLATGSRAGPV